MDITQKEAKEGDAYVAKLEKIKVTSSAEKIASLVGQNNFLNYVKEVCDDFDADIYIENILQAILSNFKPTRINGVMSLADAGAINKGMYLPTSYIRADVSGGWRCFRACVLLRGNVLYITDGTGRDTLNKSKRFYVSVGSSKLVAYSVARYRHRFAPMTIRFFWRIVTK